MQPINNQPPRSLLGWYNHKMAQAKTPRSKSQERVLKAYSRYLLKTLTVQAGHLTEY